jgi:hypothetical protein
MLGGHAGLAAVIGIDEEMTVPVMESLEFTVCETCSIEKRQCVAALVEIVQP